MRTNADMKGQLCISGSAGVHEKNGRSGEWGEAPAGIARGQSDNTFTSQLKPQPKGPYL